MTGPRRIQYVRGKSLPMNAAYVGRGSRWGNPFPVEDPRSLAERTAAMAAYRRYLAGPEQARLMVALPAVLPGLDLACYCRLDGLPCHTDVLLELANPPGTIHLPPPDHLLGCRAHHIPAGQACVLCADQIDLFTIPTGGSA